MRSGSFAVGLLAALLAVAAPAAGQLRLPRLGPLPRLGVTVSPFAGYTFASTRSGTMAVDLGAVIADGTIDSRTEGGPIGGVTVEAPVQSLFALQAMEGVHLVASLAYGRQAGGTTTLVLPGEEENELTVIRTEQSATGVLIASVGLGLRVPVVLPTVITVAPSLVRVIPGRVPDDAMDRTHATNHPGLNLGLEVALPTLLPALQVRAAVEDFITYPGSELAGRVDRFLAVEIGADTRTTLPMKPAHLPLVRFGFSLQL